MEQQTLPVGTGTRLIITAGSGGVTLRGWQERSIALETESAVAVSHEGDTITIRAAHTPLDLRLPDDVAVVIERRDGGVVTEAFFGELTVRDGGDVTGRGTPERNWGQRYRSLRGWNHGSITLERVGAVRLEVVPANLSIDTCRSVDARSVGGNLRIAHVAGDCAIDNVRGNCEIDQVEGGARLHNVGGNARLRGLASIAGLGSVGGNLALHDTVVAIDDAATIAVTVGGNARLALADTADVTIRATTGGAIRFAGAGRHDIAHGATAIYGAGRAQLLLTVGGNVEVQGGGTPRVTGPSWGGATGFSGAIGHAVSAALSALPGAVALATSQRGEPRAARGSEEQKREQLAILDMVASRRITAEEGAVLLAALK